MHHGVAGGVCGAGGCDYLRSDLCAVQLGEHFQTMEQQINTRLVFSAQSC